MRFFFFPIRRMALTFLLISFIIRLIEAKSWPYGSIVPLTFVENAVARGAVCLDGTPSAYYHIKGKAEGLDNWLIYLQGGGWCTNRRDCKKRGEVYLGSSKYMPKFIKLVGSYYSNYRKENPAFYNWNRVFVAYCDGSSFTGNVETVDSVTNVTYGGSRIFNAIMEDLLAQGMKHAKNALLTGFSSGGLATIIHCDRFRNLYPITTRVKCLSIAGYFLHKKNPLMEGKGFESSFKALIALHGSAKTLPPPCTSIMSPSLCFFPQYLLAHVKTPIFIAMSAFDEVQIRYHLFPEDDVCLLSQNCTCKEKKALQGFRRDFLAALPKAHPSLRGMWITNCVTHVLPYFWDQKMKIIGNKTFPEVFDDWYYDRNHLQVIDFSTQPRNCTSFGIDPYDQSNL